MIDILLPKNVVVKYYVSHYRTKLFGYVGDTFPDGKISLQGWPLKCDMHTLERSKACNQADCEVWLEERCIVTGRNYYQKPFQAWRTPPLV